jgi:hypothetical protein
MIAAIGDRMHRILLVGFALAALTGCIGGGTANCSADAMTLDLTLTAASLSPDDPRACRDQQVTLRIDADVDGLLHIHGYDDQVPATEVAAGEETVLEFTAVRSGQYPIEFHPADDPEGVGVGILTVDER